MWVSGVLGLDPYRPTIYRALQRTAPGSANLPADTRPGLPSLDRYDQLLPSRQAAGQSPSPGH